MGTHQSLWVHIRPVGTHQAARVHIKPRWYTSRPLGGHQARRVDIKPHVYTSPHAVHVACERVQWLHGWESEGGGGVGTRPRCWFACLWRRIGCGRGWGLAVGGGYWRLQMPLSLAPAVRGKVAGHKLDALGVSMHPCLRPRAACSPTELCAPWADWIDVTVSPPLTRVLRGGGGSSGGGGSKVWV